MRLRLEIGLAGIFLFLCLPISASACDCGYSGAPCKAFAATPYVFSGRVTKISSISIKISSGDQYQDRLVLFEVDHPYRGLESKKVVEVVTGFGRGDCGYAFREGERYLVYALPHAATGKLYTGICSRTRLLADAAADLEYLARKDDPEHGAGIEAWIEELSRGTDNKTEVKGPLRGARVRVEAQTGDPAYSAIVTTDANGRFRIWGLPAKTYRVTPVLPAGFVPITVVTASLKRGACEELHFLATPPPHNPGR